MKGFTGQEKRKNMTGNQPKSKTRAGKVSITEWENIRNKGKKDEFVSSSYSVDKNYKDKNDEWKTTNSYSYQELTDLADAIQAIRNNRVKKFETPTEKDENQE